jgi:hypothetical protein
MNTKWYISTLIILIALLGLNQEQTKVVNQQIVLQFADAETTSVNGYDDTLATITKKLQALGIANIEIIETNDAQLSIRYYSDIDASRIAEFLSKGSELPFTYKDIDQLPADLPKEQLPENYSIVVSDLHQQTDDGLGLNGKFAFELNQDYQRFSNLVFIPNSNSIILEPDTIVQVAYRMNSVIAIAIDNTSNSFPEVRAGPQSNGNS